MELVDQVIQGLHPLEKSDSSLLGEALDCHQWEVAKHIIENHKIDLTTTDLFNMTMTVVFNANKEFAEWFLARFPNEEDYSPCIYGGACTHTDPVHCIWEKCRTDAMSKLGLEGRLDLIQLLHKRLKPPAPVLDHINGCLAGASYSGHKHIMEWCSQQGATDWDTALGCALRGDQVECAEYAIEQGAEDWDSALTVASETCDLYWMKYFLQKGATTADTDNRK